MNKGLTPDEIVKRVVLPPHLAKSPYLQPFYGRVDWSVRAIFAGNLGWFSGDAADLFPPDIDRIAGALKAIEGGNSIADVAENALSAGEAIDRAVAVAGHGGRQGRTGPRSAHPLAAQAGPRPNRARRVEIIF